MGLVKINILKIDNKFRVEIMYLSHIEIFEAKTKTELLKILRENI